MIDVHPTYQVDARGKRIVILSEEEYENLLALAEVKSADPDAGLKLKPQFEKELREQEEQVRQGKEKLIPWEQVKRELGMD